MEAKEKPKTINLTINGKTVQAEPGTSVFQAAEQAGVSVPHYCYHPDLSIAGVCRMCVVDIEKQPRLQISCNTQVAEGMVVRTDTDKVKAAVKSCLELHLINHPLDCPICDKAGECKLQDFYQDYGLYESRVEQSDKWHKPKVVDIGTIMLDSERCILCTRCVRFTAEVSKSNELGIFNRGDRSELATYDRGPLKNDYTGNLADICPVGALTAKDFRFQCRVWFLDKTESVCTMCAHGCNTTVSVKPTDQHLYRVEPRRNPEVNKSWICDTGRWDYGYVYHESRLRVPLLRQEGKLAELTWHEAFQTLNSQFSAAPDRCLVVLSTQLTIEEIFDTVTTFAGMGLRQFAWVVDEAVVHELEPFDGVLKHHDLTANAAGFQALMAAMKVSWLKIPEAGKLLQSGKFDRMLVAGLEGQVLPGLGRLMPLVPKSTKVAVHATNDSLFFEGADLLLPNVTSFEKSGTVMNAMKRAQRLNAAIPWQHTARDGHGLAWGVAQGHDRAVCSRTRWKEVSERLPEELR